MRSVLFDLDGTLLNRDATLRAFCKAQCQKFQLPMTIDQYVERMVILDDNGYVRKEIVYAQMAAESDFSKELEQLLFEDYMNHFQDFSVPFEGLHETLGALKQQKFRLGLITNGRHAGQQASIKALDIESYFDVVLISESEGMAKPDAAIFERALNLLNVMAHESCYVGDHPTNDIEAARNVGLMTIWKKNQQYIGVSADEVIDTLPELITLMGDINKHELHTNDEKADWK